MCRNERGRRPRMTRRTLWRRGITSIGALLLVATAGTAAAQPDDRDRDDWRRDRDVREDRDIREDRAHFREDLRDVRRLERLVVQLDRAQDERDWREERRVRNRIRALLRQEMRESRREIREEFREGRDSRQDRRRYARQIELMHRLREIQPEIR